jgi:carboxymethylenebutenolidase
MKVQAAWKETPVHGAGTMRVYLARPEEKGGSRPVILVLQEAFGVNHHIREVTERIASLGYIAASPELFHRTGPGFEGEYGNFEPVMKHMGAMTNEGLAADLRATLELAQGEPGADPSRAASIGFCMGGRASYLANAHLPLTAAVSFYGGRIAPDLLPLAPKQHGPLMLIWGGRDKHIPPEQRRAIADALREAGKTFIDVDFSAADHGFFCNERSAYEPHSARLAWALVQEFFRDHLNS